MKNILVIGNAASVSPFLKRIQSYNYIKNIYITCNILNISDNVKTIDIREDNVEEMLKFVLENDINLTVVFSSKAISADIAGIFSANNQLIFAPEANTAKYFSDKTALKKLLYKLKIKSPQFGIFDKSPQAYNYINSAKLPVIISSSSIESEADLFACPTVSVCNKAIDSLFFRGEEKIVISEYISGHNFTTYLITDGVSTMPICTLSVGKFSDDVEGGYYTLGAYSSIPDFKISKDIENYIVYDIWEKISSSFGKEQAAYVGIVGINGVLKDDDIYIIDITSGINPCDAPVIFNTIDEDLISLFEACAIGSFTDDYDWIKTDDYSYISLSLFCNSEGKEIKENENIDLSTKIFNGEYLSQKGFVGTIWAKGSTLTRAKHNLAEEINRLLPEFIKFRKDILADKNY